MTEPKYTTEDLATYAALFSRMMLGRALGQTAYKGNRDYYESLGYPVTLEISQLVQRYERQDIAGRVVDLPAQDTWRKPPRISEGDGEEETEFVREWKALAERLHVWNVLMRADKLSGIGRYGVLLVGVRGEGTLADEVKPGSLQGQKDVLYLRPFSEEKAAISAWDEDQQSPRYGLPTRYDVQLREDQGAVKVHWTRVLHVAEGKRDSEVYGTPRLERPYNRLDDLIKIVGGGAESAWLNMRPGTLLTAKEGYKLPTDADFKDQVDEEIYRYLHDIARIMRLEGMEAQQIGPSEVPDIGPLFDAVIGLIAASSGIPQRVLLGSAQGELAAAQEDVRQWAGEIDGRQQNYAEPEILRPFVAMMQRLGALPETPEGYSVGEPDENGEHHWPPIVQLTALEQAELRERTAGAVQRLVNPLTGEFPLTGPEARELLGYPPEPEGAPGGDEDEDLMANVLPALVAQAQVDASQASHAPQITFHTCPLCGHDRAYAFEGHGPLLLCAGCARTYDPEVE